MGAVRRPRLRYNLWSPRVMVAGAQKTTETACLWARGGMVQMFGVSPSRWGGRCTKPPLTMWDSAGVMVVICDRGDGSSSILEITVCDC